MDEDRLLLSHVLAAAVKQLTGDCLLGSGGTTDTGFYYDVSFPEGSGLADLKLVEKKMRELLAEQAVGCRVSPPTEIRKALEEAGEAFLIEALDGVGAHEPVYAVSGPGYSDFTTAMLPPDTNFAFRLETVSGAYWMGDDGRPMLTRIGAVAFASLELLDAYDRKRAGLAEKDHRNLGQRLGIYTIMDDVGKGLPMLPPHGAAIRQELERFIIDEETARGYERVYTPALGRRELYETSGHLAHYAEFMYPPITLDEQQYILRPMTCPHHFVLYNSSPHSYRELPVRYTEISPLYRKERSGELYGLVRVLHFHLADSHIMCMPDQVEQEFLSVLDLVHFVMGTLGLEEDCSYRASLRDPEDDKYEGEHWNEAERVLLGAMDKAGLDYATAPGEASFYGPKLDVQMRNINGKEETVFTIQIDMMLPERFGMEYTDSDGVRRRPVVIHRSSVGCIERTIAFLLEKYAGALPLWLSPIQVRLLPVSEAACRYAEGVACRLRKRRLRVDIDARGESLGRRLHAARKDLVPYIAVAGAKEAGSDTLSVTNRDTGTKSVLQVEDVIEHLCRERDERTLTLAQ